MLLPYASVCMPGQVNINGMKLGEQDRTYIIAEIGSNHDGSKERAKKLIDLAAECGADAVKFQAFKTDRIVSAYGFDGLKAGFQQDWEDPVYQVYQDAELPREWLDDLVPYARNQGIDFLCSPYDYEAVDLLSEYDVPAFKIGSGDITWHNFLEYVAKHNQPIILATGASTVAEIEEALEVIRPHNNEIILLQCVTNYPSEFDSANIRAMSAMDDAFEVQVGYSDHTPGNTVPLAAVSRGACVIEKHFTDDKSRSGPDHEFAMNVNEFKQMVTSVRKLNTALGSSHKRVYEEENTPRVLQRRALRADKELKKGDTITDEDITALRPCPEDALEPKHRDTITGRTVTERISQGEHFSWENV